jgi:hypothetical protein
MVIKKKRRLGRAVKKQTGPKRAGSKRAAQKERSSAGRRGATGRQSTRRTRASKRAAVRRKERKVDEAKRRLIEAKKELAAEELPKTIHPAMRKRGADSHVPSGIKRKRPSNPKEHKLEQVLEESMAGSDPVSVTQPAMPIAEKPKTLIGREAQLDERFRELVAWYILQGVDEAMAQRRARDEIDDDPRKD